MRLVCDLLSIAIALALFGSAAVAQSEPRYSELPNFHQVNEHLYRGAQPRSGGIQKLVQLGIRTVINLRDDDERARAEEREARAAGLGYFNVPLPRFSRPSNKQVERLLEIINTPENQPVFVHCNRGADRAGTIIAAYRIAYDGWTSEQAKEEAINYGMHWTQVEMKEYITDYYKRSTGGAIEHYWRTHAVGRAAFGVRRSVESSPSLMRRGFGRLKTALP